MHNQLFDRNSLSAIKKWWIDIDKVNFLIIISIMVFGLMMTASSSPAIAKRIDVDKFYFLKKQMIFFILALILVVTISFLNQDNIKLFALFGISASLFLLVVVLFFGIEAKGAKRWMSVAGFTLQPSEFAKTFFVIFNAYILQRFAAQRFLYKYGVSMILLLSLLVLLLLQPDFGMSITLVVLWASQLFIYGLPMIIVIILAILGVFGAISAYLVFPHVEDRINKFLDTDGKNYQVERSIDAFNNGSFFGVGPNNGVVKNFIPDAHTDFIFAVIGEEYGVLTCMLVVLVFAYLITRIIKYCLDEENMFVYLSLFGLMIQFSMQMIVNVGASLHLLPAKGMTLPFISYGGSSMISMGICFGLILAFTKRKYHKNVDYGNLKLI